MKEIVVKWNREYFDGKLSLACLEELNKTDDKNRELVELIDTWLYYFHAAGGRAQNFSSLLARFFATGAASYLPSLWARIPPITRGGRLRGMDRVAMCSFWPGAKKELPRSPRWRLLVRL
jgi:hypothetical protein